MPDQPSHPLMGQLHAALDARDATATLTLLSRIAVSYPNSVELFRACAGC